MIHVSPAFIFQTFAEVCYSVFANRSSFKSVLNFPKAFAEGLLSICIINLLKRSSLKSVLKVYTLSKILLWIKPSYFSLENPCYAWCMHQTGLFSLASVVPQSKFTGKLWSSASVVPQRKSTESCSFAAVVPQNKSTELCGHKVNLLASCEAQRLLCHKVNLLSCVARRPSCHRVNLPSCVARRPLFHQVNLPKCEARRHHFIMTCDIFGTGQTNN